MPERSERLTASAAPFIHHRNPRRRCHLDGSQLTEPTLYCSAKLSPKQSTSYIGKKQVNPLI
jgi:hypothetical protein